jgi:predicted dehydrogenase
MLTFQSNPSRRSFLTGTPAATAAAFTIIRPELVRGSAPPRLKVGLIGCGGRGTQAIVDTMQGDPGSELVAMADAFEDKLENSLRNLKNNPKLASMQDRINVTPEKRFVGYDAFKKLLNSGIDVVFLATPPGWRPIHLEAAVEAGKHVFCEKPFGTDCMGVQRSMRAAKLSEQKKLTIVSGAQRRSDPFYIEWVDKIRNGALGDVTALYAYWVGGPVIQQRARNAQWGDFEWEHRAWYSYVWICGDQVVEQHLHNIDVCNWIMGTHPVKVQASGGAAWRPKEEIYGNIYDHLYADFVYPNGVRMQSMCRQYPKGSFQRVNEEVVGGKGRMVLNQTRGNPGYVNEHTKLMKSIRGDGPYVNEAQTVAESTMTCIMARESAYSGLEITWDMVMNSKQDLMPTQNWDYKTKVEPTPLPIPGIYKFV